MGTYHLVAPFLYVKLNIPNINFHYVKYEKAPQNEGLCSIRKAYSQLSPIIFYYTSGNKAVDK